MKKILALATALILLMSCLCLTGCGDKTQTYEGTMELLNAYIQENGSTYDDGIAYSEKAKYYSATDGEYTMVYSILNDGTIGIAMLHEFDADDDGKEERISILLNPKDNSVVPLNYSYTYKYNSINQAMYSKLDPSEYTMESNLHATEYDSPDDKYTGLLEQSVIEGYAEELMKILMLELDFECPDIDKNLTVSDLGFTSYEYHSDLM